MKAALNLDGIPTAERFIQSDGHVEVGGDERGTRVYRFNDTSLARIYEALRRKAGSDGELDVLSREERALQRYFQALVEGGMMGSVPSVDLGNACIQGGVGRDHSAKTDHQVDKRNEYRKANFALSHHQRDVVNIVVCLNGSLEQAGYAIGRRSKTRAHEAAKIVLRGAGELLAGLWRI